MTRSETSPSWGSRRFAISLRVNLIRDVLGRPYLVACFMKVGLPIIFAYTRPRKYKAELSVTPVLNNRASPALGGIAALAGAALQTGYQLTPARMVELIKSRRVLSSVGMSTVSPSSREKVIDRLLDEPYTRNDPEEVKKKIERLLAVQTNKETGTITVSVAHRDSALARMIASRVVDSASQIFVRTSRAQAQQLRIAQEGHHNSLLISGDTTSAAATITRAICSCGQRRSAQ